MVDLGLAKEYKVPSVQDRVTLISRHGDFVYINYLKHTDVHIMRGIVPFKSRYTWTYPNDIQTLHTFGEL